MLCVIIHNGELCYNLVVRICNVCVWCVCIECSEDCVLKPAMLIISGGETLFSLGGREEEYQVWGRQADVVGQTGDDI